jgi:hypothetical protein
MSASKVRVSARKSAHDSFGVAVGQRSSSGPDVAQVPNHTYRRLTAAVADYSHEKMHAALDINIPNYADAVVTINDVTSVIRTTRLRYRSIYESERDISPMAKII